MKIITVYGTKACVKCNATKSWLRRRNIKFDEVDPSEDENVANAIRAIAEADGVPCTMPYVQVSNGDPDTDIHWFDFRPDYLERYCLEPS